jgi:hypothetical protein
VSLAVPAGFTLCGATVYNDISAERNWVMFRKIFAAYHLG